VRYGLLGRRDWIGEITDVGGDAVVMITEVCSIPDVSIIIPVYNEEGSIAAVLGRISKVVWPSCSVEVIVVDDGSTDCTAEKIGDFASFRCIHHETNKGKGAAVRTGIRESRGKVVVIQDADLEYPPEYIPQLVEPVLAGKADVVFGSRFKGGIEGMRFSHLVGNRLLSLVTSLLLGVSVTDVMTGHKVFSRSVVDSFSLTENGFGVEVEMTSQSLRNGWKYTEIPIRYSYRDFGISKIGPIDGVTSLLVILRAILKG